MAIKFRSTFDFEYSASKLNYESKIALIGSCFTQRIGQRLADANFLVEQNFFGTLFNPKSIFQLMHKALTDEAFDNDLLCEKNGMFVHFESHSKCNAHCKEDLFEVLGKERESLKNAMHNSDYLFITLGSSYAYFKDEKVVANCHKQDQKQFSKRLLDLSSVILQGNKLMEEIRRVNPDLKVLLTVSPVKHLRDGVQENKLSKSQLRLLCHELSTKNANVSYLPVLEWVEEDLRDYRFYEADLAHPNALAEQYIWENFLLSMVDTSCVDQIASVHKLKHKLQQLGSIDALKSVDKEKLAALNQLLPIPIN